MRSFKTEGIIIKRRNYKDQDRILTVLTPTHGKIYVKATGVRKITSRRAGHIELLNHATLSLYQGHAYPILTEANTINSFSEIKSNFERVGAAYHLCELVSGLCPEGQENGQVFDLLRQTLEQLSTLVIPDSIGDPSFDKLRVGVDSRLRGNDRVVSDFEIQLLSILGYWNKARFEDSFDMQNFIENILERRLRSRRIFLKLQG